ncbi:phosphomannomutase/phosphoglucomutase [Patescibacteria group bacterium]|nr:phosphomannomutase/phosphoglucomutase [Patescibacteria group bacterium]
MKVDTSIFKAYDIRGIYPDSIDEEIAEKVGRAYAIILKGENPGKKLTVVVGEDMRLSSPSLKKSLIKGLTESGLNVSDVGLVSTPTFYFAVAYYKYDGGIQVSASHNPKEYNGLKMTRGRGIPVGGDTGIMEIKDLVVKNKFENAKTKGKVAKRDNVLIDAEIVQSKNIDTSKIKPFKIVADAANAMGALDLEAVFSQLSCKLVKLNFKLDGTFPAHHPDPLKEETLTQLKEAVVKEKADMGIAPDGDGDRYFFIDEKGETVPQPILRGLMAQIELKENPGATVCYDVRPGRITRDMIEEVGGKAVVTRVGHSLIKETMLKEDAVFGGESSGHYFYKFPYGTFEAPIVLVLKFLLYLSEQNKPLSEVIKPYKRYFHSGEINSDVKDKEAKMEEIVKKYSDGKLSRLDGITIEYPDYWFNVRASNTEPLLRFALEAKTKELMGKKRDEITKLIWNN